MSIIEYRPTSQAVEPTQPRVLSCGPLIERVAGDLTPFQTGRVARRIQRDRMKTAVDLARIENATILNRARIIATAQVEETEEEAHRLMHDKRMDGVAAAALKHEEASRVIDLLKDEAAHTLFKDALKGVSARYASGAIQRSGS